MKLRILNARDIRQLITVEQCIPLMRQALRLAGSGGAMQPIRVVHAQPDGRGTMGLMPGYAADPRWFGIKVLTVFPGNFGTAMATHQGTVQLFDADTGALRAILDAREITAIRTAAATAVATEVLARKDAHSLAIFGYGEQGHSHAHALTTVKRFDSLVIWGRDLGRSLAFVAKLQKEFKDNENAPKEIRATDSLEEAARADVICTTTAAREPFYRAAWLRPGQHINLVGSSIAATSEVEPEVVARSKYFVDFKDSALALAGDFRRARDAGLVDDSHIRGSIGQVLDGAVPGRTADSDITSFKSLGMIAEDLVTADFLLKEAERREVGAQIDW